MTPDPQIEGILNVEQLPAAKRSLRIAIVTGGPGVAEVAGGLVSAAEGLRACGHEIQLVRPKGRGRADGAELRLSRLLSKQAFQQLWRDRRPDVIAIDAAGQFGWSALQVAVKLRIPAATEFRLDLRGGMQLLRRPILGYLRKFHNRAQMTFVASDALRGELLGAGFNGLVSVVPQGHAQRVVQIERGLLVLASVCTRGVPA